MVPFVTIIGKLSVFLILNAIYMPMTPTFTNCRLKYPASYSTHQIGIFNPHVQN